MTKSQKATFSSHVVGPLMIVRGLTVGPPRVQSPPLLLRPRRRLLDSPHL
jgi:hypothetical protein